MKEWKKKLERGLVVRIYYSPNTNNNQFVLCF